MTRRSAVTLMEVLITMFIMSIGMLALLVLFPVGAVSMAKALKDDRCASSANMAEQFAIAKNVRQDPAVLSLYTTGLPLPGLYNGPSHAVYVDPFGLMSGSPGALATTLVQRATVSYAPTPQLVDRWFSLPNDITFTTAGTPDLTYGNVERGREYTWAYLLQRPQAWMPEVVNMSVIVYRKRPTGVANPEFTYPAYGVQGTSGLVLTWAGAAPKLKRGVWLLDTSLIPIPNSPVVLSASRFYRVVNVADSGVGTASLDVQPNIANPYIPNPLVPYAITQVTVLDYVAEVFNKGTSWQP